MTSSSSMDLDIDNTIITELSPSQLEIFKRESDPHIVFIIKFGAEWCGPCQKIKQTCENYFYKINKHHKNIMCFDIDVDETIELFSLLKNRRAPVAAPGTGQNRMTSSARKERKRPRPTRPNRGTAHTSALGSACARRQTCFCATGSQATVSPSASNPGTPLLP